MAAAGLTPDHYLLTRADYINYALYHPQHGYYSTNKVRFISETESGHFATYATHGIFLSYTIINLMYLNYINSSDLRKQEVFTVVELSGGNGQLAFNALNLLQAAAKTKGGLWKELYDKIYWITYEISEPLAKLQREKNLAHASFGKFIVKNKSAIDIDEPSIDFRVSNELWDAIPWDNFIKTPDDEILVEVNIPTIYPQSTEPEDVYTRSLLPAEERFHNAISKAHFNRLASDRHFSPCYIKWERLHLPIRQFPELTAFKEKYNWYFAIMPSNTVFHMSQQACTLAEKLALIPTWSAYDGDYADTIPQDGVRGAFCSERGFGPRYSIPRYDFEPDVDITISPDFYLLRFILYKHCESDDPRIYFNHQAAILLSLISLSELGSLLSLSTAMRDLSLFIHHPGYGSLVYSGIPLPDKILVRNMISGNVHKTFVRHLEHEISDILHAQLLHLERFAQKQLGLLLPPVVPIPMDVASTVTAAGGAGAPARPFVLDRVFMADLTTMTSEERAYRSTTLADPEARSATTILYAMRQGITDDPMKGITPTLDIDH